jgi:hypothetical protein
MIRTLAAVLVVLGAAGARPVPTAPPCGLSPHDWCPSPAGDPCGDHRDEKSCRADSKCRGLPYRGESVVACIPDGKGFSSNCPTVGCISRADAPGKAPRPDVVKALCASDIGGAGADINVWRTSADEVAVLEMRGHAGQHPVAVYHDFAGNPLLSVPLKLPNPKSDLARALDRQREAVTSGLRVTATVPCGP